MFLPLYGQNGRRDQKFGKDVAAKPVNFETNGTFARSSRAVSVFRTFENTGVTKTLKSQKPS